MKYVVLTFLVLFLGFVLYTLQSTGLSRNIETHFAGELFKEIPLDGAEDITVSLTDSFALISATYRRAYPNMSEQNGLYLLELKLGSENPIL